MEEEMEWAEKEFGSAQLGDSRRTKRLVQLAQKLGEQPSASLPQACEDQANLKAAYRFFDNAAISPARLLESHVDASASRCRAVPLILGVQDTSYLEWRGEEKLLVHSTLAFTAEKVALGVIAQQTWQREVSSTPLDPNRPIWEKESQKWLTSLRALEKIALVCPDSEFVSVGDREADVYDLFLCPRRANDHLLVRAAQDRKVDEQGERLWSSLEKEPVAGHKRVQVPRRKGQVARAALLEVRYRKLKLNPPKKRKGEELPKVEVWAILVKEENPPPECEALEWLLLTTYPTESLEQALERVEWYLVRWGIEVWHKILKSGCNIEARQLEKVENLERALALYSVIAWRVLYSVTLARIGPGLSCTVLLQEVEWQALWCATHHTPIPPPTPPSLGEAVRMIGRLGGFIGRKADGEPGITVLWRGFARLHDLTWMFQLLRPSPFLS